MIYMDFSEALKCCKAGKKITRIGWNGKGMFVIYQEGYYGINEEDTVKINPYLQLKCVDGSYSMWVPSINDILAEDWLVVS